MLFFSGVQRKIWKLFWVLSLTLWLPNIVQSIRIYYLGQTTDEALSIASNIFWLQILYEVPQECLLLTLFVMFGKYFREQLSIDILTNYIQNALLVVFFVFTAIASLVMVFAESIISWITIDTSLLPKIVHYIYLESIANIVSSLVKVLLIVFVLLNDDKALLKLLIMQSSLLLGLDYIWFLSGNFSALSIAYTNLSVNLLWLCVTYFILKNQKINIFTSFVWHKNWVKQWINVGKFSGLESLIRNFMFTFVIIKMINVISMQGIYWIANSLIWGWLLVPILSMSQIAEQSFSKSSQYLSMRTFNNLKISICIIGVVLLSRLGWEPFIKDFLQISQWEDVIFVMELQMFFYIFFMLSKSLFDPIFYGFGRTKLTLLRSVLIDIGYYGIVYCLFIWGYFNPTLETISYIFGIGLLINFIISFVLYLYILLNKNSVFYSTALKS